MGKTGSYAIQILRLTLSDLRRDGTLALCQIFALAAVMMPLLVLFGLKEGVLGTLVHDLEVNPSMRQIEPRVTGTNRFDAAWLARARARPDVAFVVGDARAIAAEVDVVPVADPDHSTIDTTLVPTGPGDPLAPPSGRDWAGGYHRVALSFGEARALGVSSGGEIQILVPRVRAGVSEARTLVATVTSIVPPDRMDETRHVILASASLVFDIQRYRDGYAVPELGWPGETPPAGARVFERFRLYARTIDDVAPLTAWLRGQGIEPVSQLADIAPVQTLNRSLTTILAVIGGLATLGYIVALAAVQWSGIERKRRELALLNLIGYGRVWLLTIPLLQAFLLALAGSLTAIGLFFAAAATINAHLPIVGAATQACTLRPEQLTAATGITCLLAVLAAVLAAIRVTRIEPAAAIREI